MPKKSTSSPIQPRSDGTNPWVKTAPTATVVKKSQTAKPAKPAGKAKPKK